jgi:NAD(P)-dependent dehydrogenase (short-subunit alcohol dehydrogenase family)
MPDRFDGWTAIVTGSTRGIGAAIARRLAAEGANVVVSGRTAEEGEAVAEGIRRDGGEASFVRADMRTPDSVEALVEATLETYGGVDVLVNNAAVETYTGADEATREDWDLVVETDFRGYWLCAREASRHMDGNEAGGAIVNVASNHARLTTPEMFPYNAVKAGVEGMTRAMALDFGPRVRANAVAPGWIAVERTTRGMSEERRRELAGIHPVGRLGDPEDVAAAVAYLASEEAGYVTGTSLVVDGGRTAVMQDDQLPDYAAQRDE